MLRIAACDDNEIFLEEVLYQYLEIALTQMHLMAEVSLFSNGNKILEQFESQNPFDIVILDIDMPCINGKELASKLRICSSNFSLIFVTSFKAEIYNTLQYHVNAFLSKDAPQSLFISEFQRVIKNYTEKKQHYELFEILNMDNTKHTIKIAKNDILYFSCINKNIYLHTAKKEYRVLNKKYTTVLNHYTQQGFFEVCRGYLVNLQYIKQVGMIDLVLDDSTIIPVSRRKQKELLQNLSNMILLEVY